jgi:DNA gyrase, A subunit
MSDKYDEFDDLEKEIIEETEDNTEDSAEVLEVMRRTEMSNEIPIFIEDEIKNSYLDYSMSVIVSRALPDVRDGLKPVHRRILFAMNDMGMGYDKPYKKSARIVGEVLGKYHPHGDSAVYNSMVRMAQDFNTRYMLVDGHGNFGSVDGDSAAAMRYTEARMAKITSELLVDIDKDTIDWRKNFDESLDEPKVLPAKLPNLLLNGTTGIAVGMATNIPPHNLREVSDAIIALIDNKDISVDELITHIKGPDFPTGGIIYGKSGIYSAYKTGRGKVRVSGKTHIEKDKKSGKESIVITEIPYQVNRAKLIERIAELVKDKRVTGISDLRDESKTDTRIVIELKKGEESELILNSLYKFTDLQTTFGIIMLALVNDVPRVLNLKQILVKYLEHRYDVIVRKTRYELNKAKKRAHILEGFRKALDHIDEIIRIIRASSDGNTARIALMEKFDFTDIQARAILDMRLQRLTGLEREKIENEYKELLILIKDLEDILANDSRVYEIIRNEVLELKEKYGDDRRTDIENDRLEIGIEDLIKNEDVIVTITKKGYIKRMSLDAYKAQKRGGQGVSSTTTVEDDVLKDIYTAKTLDKLMIFSDKGKVYSTKVYEIAESSKQARGKLIQNIIDLEENEKVSVIIRVDEKENDTRDLVFITKSGIIKKTKLEEFRSINKNGKKALTFKDDSDEVKFVGVTSGSGNDEIFIATKDGIAIRFSEKDIRSMGRSAAGVRAIKLNEGDAVVSADIINSNDDIEKLTVLTISSKGYGKRTPLEDYKTQSRGGKGLKNYKLVGENNFVVYSAIIKENEVENGEINLIAISSSGTVIRTIIKDLSVIGRSTQGVRIQKLKHKDEYLVSADRVISESKEEDVED